MTYWWDTANEMEDIEDLSYGRRKAENEMEEMEEIWDAYNRIWDRINKGKEAELIRHALRLRERTSSAQVLDSVRDFLVYVERFYPGVIREQMEQMEQMEQHFLSTGRFG